MVGNPKNLISIAIGTVLLAATASAGGYIVATKMASTSSPPTEVSPVAPATAPQPQTYSSQTPAQPETDAVPHQLSELQPAIEIQTTTPPPPLPVYIVPAPPEPGVIWIPGHWRWANGGYFWVPGTWVHAPVSGVLWTPGYWGRSGVSFTWHEGYWAPHVGFYGGIHYGGGYIGVGFVGGGWNNGVYKVNRAVTNVSTITNVTNVTNVTNNYNTTNTSFNGGPGGTTATPTAYEKSVATERHLPPTEEQQEHLTAASKNPALMETANHGSPAIAATIRANDFSHGVVSGNKVESQESAAGDPDKSIPPETQKSLPPKMDAGESVSSHTPPVPKPTNPATNPSPKSEVTSVKSEKTSKDSSSFTTHSVSPNKPADADKPALQANTTDQKGNEPVKAVPKAETADPHLSKAPKPEEPDDHEKENPDRKNEPEKESQ